MMKRNEKGFTLIELLIVIVIIGILAGVLISVIDPTSQQNRARDAGAEAAINKMVLATEGYISAYGKAPDEVQFFAQFKTGTVIDAGSTCAAVAGTECFLAIVGNTLPVTCSGTVWSGDDTSGTGTQCQFRYTVIDVNAGQFEIYGKSHGLANRIFRFQNYGSGAGQIMHGNATTLADWEAL